MSYLLLWVELLAAWLFYTALMIALAMRRKNRWAGGLIALVGFFPPMFQIVVGVISAASLAFYVHLHEVFFWWVTTLGVAWLIAVILIRRRAGQLDSSGQRAVLSWSPQRIGAGLLFVGLILLMTIWNLNLQSQLEVQAVRAKAGAIALSVRAPIVPDSQDAGPVYQQLRKLLLDAMLPTEKDKSYLEVDATSPELEAYLARRAQPLALARRAAAMAGCNAMPAVVDPAAPEETGIPDLGPLLTAASLLDEAARYEAATGKVDLALNDCNSAYAIENHCNFQPCWIACLVSFAIDNRTSKAVAEVLPFATTREQVARAPVSDPQALRRVFLRNVRGEEAFGLGNICDLASGEGAAAREMGRGLGSANWQLWLKDDLAVYQKNMETVQALGEENFYANLAKVAAMDRPENRHGLLGANALSQVADLSRQAQKSESLRLAARVAQAATLCRLDRGSYPDAIESLVPTYLSAVPADPYDGKSLRYKKLVDGSVTIYSIGVNGKDDGGDVEQKGNKSPSDVGVILRMPAAGM